MTRYVLDTDTFSLYLQGHVQVTTAIIRHLLSELALSVSTYEELWDGWQAVIRKCRTLDCVGRAYDRLTATLTELKPWPILPFAESAARRHADLKRQKLNAGTNDLKIASIALEWNAVVVTRNLRDFGRVPGLTSDDWSK